MSAIQRSAAICASLTLALCCFAQASYAGNKYKDVNVTGTTPENPTTGDEGIQITSGDDTCTVNFPAGLTNNGDVAQEIIDQCDNAAFTITRVGNQVKICHNDKRPKVRKVNIKNKINASASTDKALRSENLIEFRGMAAGGGIVVVANGGLQASVQTEFGMTAEEIVDLLVDQLDAQTDFGVPDFSYGAEYTAAAFEMPPLDSADLGIFQLGGQDLSQTEFFSSDPGIELFQEAGPQDYPTTCAGELSTCVCGNLAGPGEGCANSTGVGALLTGAGMASLSLDSFDLLVGQAPNQPGIFFQGESTMLGGLPFGDGVRCCGGQILRLGTYLPAQNETSLLEGNRIDGAAAPVSQHPGNAGLQPGDTRCYQWWYRDPGPANPCQASYFNLSNSIEAAWGA